MATLFGISGDLLKTALTKLAGLPLCIKSDAEQKIIEFKTFGKDFVASCTLTDGIRIDASGEVILPSKATSIIANAVNEEGFYEFDTTKGESVIVYEEDKEAKLQFPTIKKPKEFPDAVFDKGEVSLAKGDFKRIAKQTVCIASTAKKEGIICVNVARVKDNMTFTATGGKRLIKASVKCVCGDDFNINIPADVLKLASKLFTKQITVEISVAENAVCLRADEWQVTARLFDGKYPDVASIFKKPLVSANVCELDLFRNAKVCCTADDRLQIEFIKTPAFNGLKLTAKNDEVKVSANVFVDSVVFADSFTPLGSGSVEVSAKYLLEIIGVTIPAAIRRKVSKIINIGIAENGLVLSYDAGATTAIIAPLRNEAGGTTIQVTHVQVPVSPPIIALAQWLARVA